MQTIDLLGFVTLGLLGGLGHCVGMCAPFVLFVSRRYAAATGPAALVPQLWYNAGRMTTYMALGAVAGALGGVVQLAGALMGVQRGALIVAGLTLTIWAVASLTDLGHFNTGGAWFGRVAGSLKGRTPGHPYLVGVFLGLLPCGLLYSAVIGAVSRGGAWQGAIAMAAFSAGTTPTLLAVSLADELLARHRPLVNRLSQAFLLLMGLWFLRTAFLR